MVQPAARDQSSSSGPALDRVVVCAFILHYAMSSPTTFLLFKHSISSFSHNRIAFPSLYNDTTWLVDYVDVFTII